MPNRAATDRQLSPASIAPYNMLTKIIRKRSRHQMLASAPASILNHKVTAWESAIQSKTERL
ncbi:hypothetical protein MES5069_190080 [Mesorhizobium escarrei]|uniref:Uncharacterized protein n=1 Tax=Mesorhizobium escarrei TaxID=666018 RepID=A0ABM9DPN7_9HYPH|nr:hypothetical protein MES5069_190080 [Mesorhizobium escarrei]